MPCFPTFLNPYRFSSFEYVVYVVYIHIYIVYYCLKLQNEMFGSDGFFKRGALDGPANKKNCGRSPRFNKKKSFLCLDVRLMKHRAHVLHEQLKGFVQR